MAQTLVTMGFHDRESPRYINIGKHFEKQGYQIVDCHTSAKGLLSKYIDLKKQFQSLITNNQSPITILVTFPGFIIMPLAWWLTRWPRRKLLFDAFVSASDTLVSDRKKYSWLNPIAWMLYVGDVVTCHMADTVLVDTQAHKKFFAKRFFLNPKRISVVYVGTREDLFHPGPKENRLTPKKYNLLFIGSFIPLQGVEYIVDAAEELSSHADIHFTLIGAGQTKSMVEKRIAKKNLKNITLLPFQPITELPHYLHSADIALGTFGTSKKADRVIAHKVYDAVACGIPVITARNEAIGERFTDGKEVFLCDPGNGSSLAATILQLQKRS